MTNHIHCDGDSATLRVSGESFRAARTPITRVGSTCGSGRRVTCWAALHYVETNPVRAGLVDRAWHWEWSSARAHVSDQSDDALLDLAPWRACWTREAWRTGLERGLGEASFQQRFRDATLTGRPLGAQGFVAALEARLGRPLAPQKRGRKPATRTATAVRS